MRAYIYTHTLRIEKCKTELGSKMRALWKNQSAELVIHQHIAEIFGAGGGYFSSG